jgi:hypothetical protein
VTTGSNYAKDWMYAFPIRPELTDGPFLHKLYLRVPHYVLTKTHCSGYCDDCSPASYIVTDKDFEQGCLRAESPTPNHGYVSTHYDSSVPVKAVHIIRNPFDNIVARMHLAVKRRERIGWAPEQVAAFESSKDGLDAWCLYVDGKFAHDDYDYFSDDIKAHFDGLPCYADWYRYVQWHNRAAALTEKLGIPVHYLFYENYTTAFNKTVAGLLDFLDESARQPPSEFIPGKTYEGFFEDDHARKAAKFVQAVASPTTWEQVKHYFDRYLD